ncbi:hypothetical protein EAE99_003533 [Botrytis elliptica]|nr:hypothetical protein EAE99_003533 [Botrytis elliptica]
MPDLSHHQFVLQQKTLQRSRPEKIDPGTFVADIPDKVKKLKNTDTKDAGSDLIRARAPVPNLLEVVKRQKCFKAIPDIRYLTLYGYLGISEG